MVLLSTLGLGPCSGIVRKFLEEPPGGWFFRHIGPRSHEKGSPLLSPKNRTEISKSPLSPARGVDCISRSPSPRARVFSKSERAYLTQVAEEMIDSGLFTWAPTGARVISGEGSEASPFLVNVPPWSSTGAKIRSGDGSENAPFSIDEESDVEDTDKERTDVRGAVGGLTTPSPSRKKSDSNVAVVEDLLSDLISSTNPLSTIEKLRIIFDITAKPTTPADVRTTFGDSYNAVVNGIPCKIQSWLTLFDDFEVEVLTVATPSCRREEEYPREEGLSVRGGVPARGGAAGERRSTGQRRAVGKRSSTGERKDCRQDEEHQREKGLSVRGGAVRKEENVKEDSWRRREKTNVSLKMKGITTEPLAGRDSNVTAVDDDSDDEIVMFNMPAKPTTSVDVRTTFGDSYNAVVNGTPCRIPSSLTFEEFEVEVLAVAGRSTPDMMIWYRSSFDNHELLIYDSVFEKYLYKLVHGYIKKLDGAVVLSVLTPTESFQEPGSPPPSPKKKGSPLSSPKKKGSPLPSPTNRNRISKAPLSPARGVDCISRSPSPRARVFSKSERAYLTQVAEEMIDSGLFTWAPTGARVISGEGSEASPFLVNVPPWSSTGAKIRSGDGSENAPFSIDEESDVEDTDKERTDVHGAVGGLTTPSPSPKKRGSPTPSPEKNGSPPLSPKKKSSPPTSPKKKGSPTPSPKKKGSPPLSPKNSNRSSKSSLPPARGVDSTSRSPSPRARVFSKSEKAHLANVAKKMDNRPSTPTGAKIQSGDGSEAAPFTIDE
ncbi:hypothetical protein BZA05DRAFT_459049 [Tricharina praecox]|uniref:uncharacterized protein n=1 Tax=Tricharina praecox TaxID=43433 RepID=UPI0022206BF6|nr:uncharacterized protein BZA05DRAFT_459049 [Tricharina praecox]KAI5845534.1 hypothetical protein BZA05DRAFT_459049 [Tricharina praecox]